MTDWIAIRREAEQSAAGENPDADLDDPKHPTYHDRYADAYDMREGK